MMCPRATSMPTLAERVGRQAVCLAAGVSMAPAAGVVRRSDRIKTGLVKSWGRGIIPGHSQNVGIRHV